MPNYQGHFMPRPDENHYMPGAFANFIANENPASISMRASGVIELYSEAGWGDKSQQIPVLLERFRDSAQTDDGISAEDIEDAQNWAAGFKGELRASREIPLPSIGSSAGRGAAAQKRV